MVSPPPSQSSRRRVRVWFGSHPIADQIAEQTLAARFEAGMRRRFGGLRITNDPVPAGPDETPRP